jgi:hypothetical protein
VLAEDARRRNHLVSRNRSFCVYHISLHVEHVLYSKCIPKYKSTT